MCGGPHYSHGVSRCHPASHAKIPQSEIFFLSFFCCYYFCPKNNFHDLSLLFCGNIDHVDKQCSFRSWKKKKPSCHFSSNSRPQCSESFVPRPHFDSKKKITKLKYFFSMDTTLLIGFR